MQCSLSLNVLSLKQKINVFSSFDSLKKDFTASCGAVEDPSSFCVISFS